MLFVLKFLSCEVTVKKMPFKPLTSLEKERIAQYRDEMVFKSYFLRNYKVLERYAFGFLKDYALAQDVCSEVMWKMWHLGSDLMHVSSVEGYLLRMVKNRCLNLLRLNQPVYLVPDDFAEMNIEFPDPERLMMESERVKEIQQAIDALPQKTKQAFLLVKEESRSYQEAAEIMNISKNTVDRHIQIALAKIWQSLKNR
ncbi:MAG: RNA polymerase sigma factor [Sphingobacterium hotanense]